MGERGRSHYKRKMYFTREDRILLHLLQFVGYERQVERPDELTQFGIADATDLGRSTISKSLRLMMRNGVITGRRAHVPSGRLRRTTYLLTERGIALAKARQDEIEKELILVRGEDGSTRRLPLKEISRQLPKYASTTEVVVHVSQGVFDMASFIKGREKTPRFVDFTERVPRLRYFFGRTDDLREVDRWVDSRDSKFLALTGLPGIGKTTMLVRRLEDWRERTSLFWYRLMEWSTARNVLNRLAEFLDRLDRKQLSHYLAAGGEMDLEEVSRLLEQDLGKLNAILIFDDCHKASEEIQHLLFALKVVLDNISGPKVIVAGRRVPSFYDRRDVKVNDVVKEIEIGGLDKVSSGRLLQVRSVEVSRQTLDAIYATTKGHPLFLELIDPARGTRNSDIVRYLEEDLVARLASDELAILEAASVFRYPVPPGALFYGQEADMGSLRSVVDQWLLRETSLNRYEIHDLLKEFFSGRLAPARRKRCEALAARYYLSCDTEADTLEAVYHLFEAGEPAVAAELLAAKGQAISKKGHSEELRAMLDRVGQVKLPSTMKLSLALLKGDVVASLGDWTSAIDVYATAARTAERERDLARRAEALRSLGDLYLRRKERKKATEAFKTSLSLFKTLGDLKGVSAVHFGLGTLYEEEGSLDKALKHYRRAARLVKENGDQEGVARYLSAYAGILESKGEYDKAIKLMKEGLAVAERNGNLHEIARVTVSLGKCYAERKQLNEALDCYREGISLARRIGNQRIVAYGLMNTASAMFQRRNMTVAEASINEAKGIFQELGERVPLALCDVHLAFIEDARGRWDFAKKDLNAALESLRRNRSPIDLFHSLTAAGNLYLKNGEFGGASDMFSSAKTLAKQLGRNDYMTWVENRLAEMKAGHKPASAPTTARV